MGKMRFAPIAVLGVTGTFSMGFAPAHGAGIGGPAVPMGSSSISQMAHNTAVANSGIACRDPSITFATSWWRRFYFGEHGAPASAFVRGVDVAVETGLPTPVTLHLYSIPHGVPVDTIALGQLTWIGSGSALNDGRELQALAIPASGWIDDAVGNDLVVEYRIDGSPSWFFAGANGTAETHPSFMSSASCNTIEPTTMADLNFPGAHLAMVVNIGPGAPTVRQAFAPARIDLGASSTLTITLGNFGQPQPATLSADLTGPLPPDLTTATPNASTTCPDGHVTTTGGSITLAAGSRIPAAGSCEVDVEVTAASGGIYTTSIPAGQLATDLGSNTAAATADLAVVPAGGGNGVASSGYYSIFSPRSIPATVPGLSINMASFAISPAPFMGAFDRQTADWDFEFIGGPFVNNQLVFDAYETHHSRFAVDGNGEALLLREGDVVGPHLTFASSRLVHAPAFHAGVDGYAGVKVGCDGRLVFPVADTACYGFIHVKTGAPNGFPAILVDAALDGDGQPITISRPLASDPVIGVEPVALDLTAPANGTSTATLHVGNTGGHAPLTYMMFLDGNGACEIIATVGWLMASPDYATVAHGSNSDALVIADPAAAGLQPGTYATNLCIWSNDGTRPLVTLPTTLTVTAPVDLPCSAGDTVFCDGFDRARSGTARVYDSRDAFVAAVEPGFHENRFDNLHPSIDYEPALQYVDPVADVAYTIDSLPFADHLWFVEGVMKTEYPRGRMVVTFTGAPITAVGGNFYSTIADAAPFVGEWVVLTLGDGTTETFRTAGSTDFRGFTSTVPITRLTIDTPRPLHSSNPALDNLIIGRAR